MKEIIVSLHAEKRMHERMRTQRHRMLKIAKKAWNSKELNAKIDKARYVNFLLDRLPYNNGEKYEFRSFSGFVFVFIEDTSKVRLVTVLAPKRDMHMTRESAGVIIK